MRVSGLFRVALAAAAAVAAFAPGAAEASSSQALALTGAAAATLTSLTLAPVSAQRKLTADMLSRVLHDGPDETYEGNEEKEKEEEELEEEEEAAAHSPAPKKHKKHKKKATPAPAAEEEPATEEFPATTTPAPTQAPATEAPEVEEEPTAAPKKHKKKHKKTEAPAAEEEEVEEETPTTKPVSDKKIKGDKNEGVIDGSSEGSAEIDKIDLRNQDGWVSVYNDPPLLVIKASLYAFISYNDTNVCDSFNMTLNAVEQKQDGNGTYEYHVVTYINCTKNGEDETQGRFILNFIPEGKRLLLTECGHREEGEIVNWLKITNEVPECMTPSQRKKFLAQPMKHIHANNGTSSEVQETKTDFFSRLEDLDGKEVAIAGSATVALIAVIVVIVVFVMRKRKAQRDLERTIAGAKAEHAVEDEENVETEVQGTKERKGLMDSAKAKPDEADVEEGSFVNSPAVRV